MAPLLNGILCQVLLYTSTIYSTLNLITVEFSTPTFVSPDSMLFCFNDTGFAMDSSTFRLTSLIAGGNIFNTSGQTQLVPAYTFWQDAEFFNLGFNDTLSALEAGSLDDVLASDAYYAGSYAQRRYDDFQIDPLGVNIRGVVSFTKTPNSVTNVTTQILDGNCFLLSGDWQSNTLYQMTFQVQNLPPPAQPQPASNVIADGTVVSGFIINQTAVLDLPPQPPTSLRSPAPAPAGLASPPPPYTGQYRIPGVFNLWLNGSTNLGFDTAITGTIVSGALVTVEVLAENGVDRITTTYLVNGTVINGATVNRTDALVVTQPFPLLWMAPVSQEIITQSWNGMPLSSFVLSVRGSKYGISCPLRPATRSVMGQAVDACLEAVELRLISPTTAATTSQATCARLIWANRPPGNITFPYNVPGIIDDGSTTAYNLDSFPDSAGCSTTSAAVSSKFGGQCISCGLSGSCVSCTNTSCAPCSATPAAGAWQYCACPTYVVVNKLGPVACGAPIWTSPTNVAAVTDATTLAQQLCAQYTSQFQGWKQHVVADRLIAHAFLEGFLTQASYFMDYTLFNKWNQTFYSTLVFDGRFPASPTRQQGLKPNCNRCKEGVFKNAFNVPYNGPSDRPEVLVYDWHFDAMNVFRLIGYLLYNIASVSCPTLWDVTDPLKWTYGFYEDILCKPFPANY